MPNSTTGRPFSALMALLFLSRLRKQRDSLFQVFLAETVETGTKNHCVIEATPV